MSAQAISLPHSSLNRESSTNNPQAISLTDKAFLKRASSLASQIIRGEDSYCNENGANNVIVIRHHCSPWYSPFYTPIFPLYVDPVGCRRDGDDSAKALFAIVAGVAAGIALFAIGSAISRIQDANAELSNAEFIKQKNNNLWQVADLQEKICNRIKTSAMVDLALRITLFVGSGVALLATLSVIPAAYATAGAIAALLSVGSMLFKWGLDSGRQNLHDALTLHEAIEAIKV